MDFDDIDLFCNYCIISSIVRDAKEKTETEITGKYTLRFNGHFPGGPECLHWS